MTAELRTQPTKGAAYKAALKKRRAAYKCPTESGCASKAECDRLTRIFGHEH